MPRAPAPDLPDYDPQLATLVRSAPSGPEWVHEIKLDGYRMGCLVSDGRIRLVSRSGRDWTSDYPEVAAAAAGIRARSAVLDGEVTVVLPDGRTSFQALQNAAADARREGLTYFAFDLLYLDGRDLRPLSLEARKRELRRLVSGTAIKYSEHLEASGPAVFEQACKLGAEGIVSKRRDRPHHASRNKDWLTVKCAQRQDRSPAVPRRRTTHPRTRTRAPSARVADVPISTPERLMYPSLSFTKLDLARLYADLAEWILPHIALRPLTLVRCEHGASRPDALRTQCRFLRHTAGWHLWVPEFVRRIHIEEQRKTGEYLVVDSAKALAAIINGDILELHAWNSKADRLEQPDRIVFDLDPGPAVPWSQLVESAWLMRLRLERLGLRSWVKSTGGKGLHVVVPIEPAAGWDECFAFARSFAEAVVRASPELMTVSFGRANRRGRILVDYKRNHRTAVSIATFSTRARPSGPLSVPLRWEELAPDQPPRACTVLDARDQIASWRSDPWEDYWRTRQVLPGS